MNDIEAIRQRVADSRAYHTTEFECGCQEECVPATQYIRDAEYLLAEVDRMNKVVQW